MFGAFPAGAFEGPAEKAPYCFLNFLAGGVFLLQARCAVLVKAALKAKKKNADDILCFALKAQLRWPFCIGKTANSNVSRDSRTDFLSRENCAFHCLLRCHVYHHKPLGFSITNSVGRPRTIFMAVCDAHRRTIYQKPVPQQIGIPAAPLRCSYGFIVLGQ